MTDRRSLLFEIGCEELPPKALLRLMDSLKASLLNGLKQAGLDHGPVHAYAAPRRLAIKVEQLVSAQADCLIERRGPAMRAAYGKDGQASQAALGFARSCGVDVDTLETLETTKGAWLVHRSEQQGQSVGALLPGLLSEALDRLPIPKRMRWADLDCAFVRPVHWLVLLYGHEVIPMCLFGLDAGRDTYGHRFHAPEAMALASADDYPAKLEEQGFVKANFVSRRACLRQQVEAAAAEAGGTAVIDPTLLDEVTGMVEWPHAVLGSFDARFLDIPHEALVSAMKGHQKYFHLVSASGTMMPAFITISNIESREPDVVRQGNERVIRPRLADAEFFWRQDCAQPLSCHRDGLKGVLFQKSLGTLHDKTARIAALAAHIAEALKGGRDDVSRHDVIRAADLAKCDLLSGMVGEFPELQGVMGRYYALHDGESATIALAIEEQYLPRFAGDDLPVSLIGSALATADKLDTLLGIFAIGQAPTGDRDPFALRRSALGILRILVEGHLALDLVELIDVAAVAYEQQGMTVSAEVRASVFDFMTDRLRAYFSAQGVAADVFEAVRLCRPTVPADFAARIHAVAVFRERPEAAGLAQANKRIRNILRKTDVVIPEQVDPDLLSEPAERVLADAMSGLQDEIVPLVREACYPIALARLASLHEPVDAYFDGVMVMVDDVGIRGNRLAQLRSVSRLFLQVADISALQQAG